MKSFFRALHILASKRFVSYDLNHPRNWDSSWSTSPFNGKRYTALARTGDLYEDVVIGYIHRTCTWFK